MSFNSDDEYTSDNENDITDRELHIKLLQKLCDSNNSLTKKVDEQGRALADLTQKIDEISPEPRAEQTLHNKSRRRRTASAVPRTCSLKFRHMYSTLKRDEDDFSGFILTESYHSRANQKVFVRVRNEVISFNGGSENCGFTKAQLEAAAKRYHKSLKDAYGRKKKDKNDEQHKAKCRKQGRIREKLHKRMKAVESLKCKEEIRAKMETILKKEYMSSDESDLSEDEEGRVVMNGYLTKKLPWERPALTRLKKLLDKHYIGTLPQRSRRTLLPRRDHSMPSSRPAPENGVAWAVRANSFASTPSNDR